MKIWTSFISHDRERNILSLRNQKKPLPCFANLPGQTHAKTDPCLFPLCSEEQSWKKCHQVGDQQHRAEACRVVMNHLTSVIQTRKTNLLREGKEEIMADPWLALDLQTVALKLMYVLFACKLHINSLSNFFLWQKSVSIQVIRRTHWLMSCNLYIHAHVVLSCQELQISRQIPQNTICCSTVTCSVF